jgi:hypothetical protein
MSRPERIATDPFSTVVELTSAVLARRAPAEFVYDRGPSFLDRLARLFDRDSLPRPEGSIQAANDASAGA